MLKKINECYNILFVGKCLLSTYKQFMFNNLIKYSTKAIHITFFFTDVFFNRVLHLSIEYTYQVVMSYIIS